jgi:hypothetical protein
VALLQLTVLAADAETSGAGSKAMMLQIIHNACCAAAPCTNRVTTLQHTLFIFAQYAGIFDVFHVFSLNV